MDGLGSLPKGFKSSSFYYYTDFQSVGVVTRNTTDCSPLSSLVCSTNSKNIFEDYFLQSEEVTDDIPSSESRTEEKSEVVSFLDNAPSDVFIESQVQNPVAMVDKTPDTSLGRFLARPTLIETITWSTSDTTGVKDTYAPWQAFLNNAVIKKKLDNYAFLRGKLHLKYVINGTPFQYGLMRACYSPLLNLVTDKIRTSSLNPSGILIPYSQQPGAWISPQANSGAELTLPFFYHKNWVELGSSTDLINLGTINAVIYAPLRVASASGLTSVTIRAYAWMTDVELMGATLGLAVQGDEYGEGPVSKPATALANFAATLVKVPFIGPFARATEIGAGAVSRIASLFGYTNVQVIDNVHGFQPMNAPHLATTDIGAPIQKLTVDAKQELSIDPSLHGLSREDELSINYLKKRESFFGSGTWQTSDSYGTTIFCTRITPNLYDYGEVQNSVTTRVGSRVYHTPLSYMSEIFRHWRGDLIIRIKVVASKFHKGRLKISYDPRYDITSSDPGENAVYTQIIDIGEKDDFEITIPYHQATAWLKTEDTNFATNWSTGTAKAPRQYFDNGVLTVRVLTTLQAPISSSVSLLFFVKGGDTFEFAEPHNMVSGARGYIPSFFALQGEDKVDIGPSSLQMGEPTTSHDKRYHQNFGEAVVSLRKLLHRFNILSTEYNTLPGSTYYCVATKVLERMPYTPGFTPVGITNSTVNKIVAASGTANFCYESMHLLPYITNLFVGYRGSVNYALTPLGNNFSSFDAMTVQKLGFHFSDYRQFQYYQQATSYSDSAKRNFWRANFPYNGLGGMALTSTRTNGSLTVTLPDYNHFNFALCDPRTWNGVSTVTDDQFNRQYLVTCPMGVNNSEMFGIQTAAAAGPDFTCHFFLCCPTLDYVTANLTPT